MPIVPIKQIFMSIIHKEISFLVKIQKKYLKNKEDYYTISNKNSTIVHQEEGLTNFTTHIEMKRPDQLNINKEGKSMEDLNVSLEKMVDYFIALFRATGERYSCSRTKLGKLISIVAFKFAHNNYKLLSEKIYRYDNCGTYIKELSSIVDRDVYVCLSYEDNKNVVIPLDAISLNIASPICDNIVKNNELVATIRTVFSRFGAYKATDLGDEISALITTLSNFVSEDGSIDLNIFNQKTNIDDYERELKDNRVVSYIFS